MDRTRVFISYSRQDLPFVDALYAALRERGYDAFLDRHDIAPGEPWRERLETLLLSADAVVYVVTAASVTSPICSWEIERALGLTKRLIPLAHGPAISAAPRILSDLNFIFSDDPGVGTETPPAPTATALDKIAAAIDTDILWERERTRLTELAHQWAAGGRSNHSLLRRSQLNETMHWLASQPRGALGPAELLADFIRASDDLELQNASFAFARTEALEAYVLPLLNARLSEIESEIAAARAQPFLKHSLAETKLQAEADLIRNFKSPEGRWHPQKAGFVETAGAQADYVDVFQFPCCGKYVTTDFGLAPVLLSQFRADGCSDAPV